MDNTMLKGMMTGFLATFLLFTIVLAAGSEPRSTKAKTDCVCPDSTKIESPRGLSAH